MNKLITDLIKIKRLAERNRDKNWEFRSFLKGYDIEIEELDSMVHRLNKQVSSQIDCTQCANCCREVYPILHENDIKNFSKGLGISVTDFHNQYLDKDDESEGFLFRQLPCPFLDGNLCTNYEHRPDNCRSFPHLHKKNFVFRTIGIIDNCSVCPIVFNVYELLKNELWHNFQHLDFF